MLFIGVLLGGIRRSFYKVVDKVVDKMDDIERNKKPILQTA